MNKQELLTMLVLSEQESGLVQTLNKFYGANIKLEIGFSESICNCSIDELFFSVRSQNALKRASVFTVGDLIDLLNQERIRSIRNLGRKSVSEIKTRILQLGFDRLSDLGKVRFFKDLMERNPEKTAMLCNTAP